MAEIILTRVDERGLVRATSGLNFLVLDELHTYRGRQVLTWHYWCVVSDPKQHGLTASSQERPSTWAC